MIRIFCKVGCAVYRCIHHTIGVFKPSCSRLHESRMVLAHAYGSRWRHFCSAVNARWKYYTTLTICWNTAVCYGDSRAIGLLYPRNKTLLKRIFTALHLHCVLSTLCIAAVDWCSIHNACTKNTTEQRGDVRQVTYNRCISVPSVGAASLAVGLGQHETSNISDQSNCLLVWVISQKSQHVRKLSLEITRASGRRGENWTATPRGKSSREEEVRPARHQLQDAAEAGNLWAALDILRTPSPLKEGIYLLTCAYTWAAW